MQTVAAAKPAPRPSLRDQAAHIVSAASGGQEHLVRLFAGPDGLLGAVVENAAKDQDIAWLTPHADAVLAGPLLGAHGEDLGRDAKIRQGLLLSPMAALAQSLAPKRHSILVGTAGPMLTLFFDPNCVYCHHLYGALSPAIAGGRVRVRFVLVGTLKASSSPRAASILAAADPARALALNEKHYNSAAEEGGFPIASSRDPVLVSAVASNSALFSHAGMVGTPTMLYCDMHGDVQLKPGVPQDMKALIADAGDCPGTTP